MTEKITAKRSGFTLLELLIATAATLLIMASLTRAFSLIGITVRDSRAAVSLSSDTRDINFRLRNDLNAVTASTDPTRPDDGVGYFMYQEGPLAKATTASFFGYGFANVTENTAQGYLPLSRWGDNDDYLAFTAKADEGNPFSGVVPWGVLEAQRAVAIVSAGGAYTVPAGYDAFQPVTITSDYAEVVYWVAPRISTGTPFATDNGVATDGMNEDGMPNYIDVDSNGLPTGTANTDSDGYPDELVLYRRTLLIRPDLNVSFNDIPASIRAASFQNTPTTVPLNSITTMRADQPTLCMLRQTTSAFEIDRADRFITPDYTAAAATSGGIWEYNAGIDQPNWLVGMAAVSQQMDLSVARDFVLAPSATSGGIPVVNTGRPSVNFSANNLEQLRDPHRRFAHVMMPGSLSVPAAASFGASGGSLACSMPLLALSPPNRFLTTGVVRTPATTTSLFGGGVADKFTLNGYLRPEFALGGSREGEDMVATNIVSFDVQAFDTGAPVFVSGGADLDPGRSGIDDDLNGTVDDLDEMGAILSDDRAIAPDDPYFFFGLRNLDSRTATIPGPISRPMSRGTFVDLGYFFQTGGNVRGEGSYSGSGTFLMNEYGTLCSNAFSGMRYTSLVPPPPAAAPGFPNNRYLEIWPGLRRSGKCLFRRNAQFVIQPTFDSWTNGYETDALNQVSYDTTWRPSPVTVGNVNDINSLDVGATYWVFNGSAATISPTVGPPVAIPPPPAPALPFDFTDPQTNATVFDNGSVSRDTLPPIEVKLPAIKITVENYDPTTKQVSTSEIVHHFGK
ncbi:PulJ/GspJ family protein [Rubripirellula tenax]|nr:prepilin-type N-terminal cleavage/methylation domain-containing protein [Rubripirellula tenax]